MNRQNESSAEATTENIENKLDPNTPEILESKREKNSKEHVSNPSRLDIEGYIFKDSKLIKKKKKVYTDVYGVDSDSIVVKSNTTNHYKKHRSKSHHPFKASKDENLEKGAFVNRLYITWFNYTHRRHGCVFDLPGRKRAV